MSAAMPDALLASLRPVADLKVMDLVAEAGVDVGPWAFKEGGAPVTNPRANPNYCYEWAFGTEHEPIVLCVWHESLHSQGDSVAYSGNMRARAAQLESIVLDRRESSKTRSRAKQQAKRCDSFDRRVQRAWRKTLPIRVILLVGERADTLGHDASKVSLRRLDSDAWHVHSYDDATGAFTLVRGAVPSRSIPVSIEPPHEAVSADLAEAVRFVDQFSAPDVVERKERLVDAYVRSPDVRRMVLQRAGGCCECCGRQGFLTASGQIYLETHHVVPLCEGGSDSVSNVVALCPDDHRRAHFAMERQEIREKLLAMLGNKRMTA